jgi:hypothetical protein
MQHFHTAGLLYLLSIETNGRTILSIPFAPPRLFPRKMEIYLEESLPTAGENSELSGVGGVLNKCLYTRPCAEEGEKVFGLSLLTFIFIFFSS